MANRRSRQSRRNRRQHGGSPSVAYTGDTIMAAGGAPFEVRTAQDPHCMMGGRRSRRQRQSQRRQKNQRGGGCGCMGSSLMQRGGGGSGNGGYSVMLGQNQNVGYPQAYVKGPCLQMGGDPKQLINSYQVGYGLTQPVNTNSANYMDYQSYGRQCMGGGKRRKSKSRR